jgi:hypothetical protein
VAEGADVDGHLLDLRGYGRDGGRRGERRVRDALPRPPPPRRREVNGDEREEEQEREAHGEADEHPQAQPQHRRLSRQLVPQQRRGRRRHCRPADAGTRSLPARSRAAAHFGVTLTCYPRYSCVVVQSLPHWPQVTASEQSSKEGEHEAGGVSGDDHHPDCLTRGH